MDNQETIDGYWDCECQDQYIHPKTVAYCPICGCHSSDQPDSMRHEVFGRESE